jgi:serine/threonine protein kinase
MIGRLLSNRYELLEKIGDGGMSTVYKAQCHVLNRFVAIKILKSEFNEDKDLLSKFDKEAKAAASLQHNNIVNIYDVGHDGDVHFIVMELVSSKTLKDYIKSQDVFLKNNQIIHIAAQIADALQAAHDKGIIHRDIKPQNILMTEDGRVKVADFGIARAVTSSTIVNTNEAIGSVHYASPEQSRGGFVDKRSDIYSFGILLYELATGRVPFEGDTPITIALKHLKEEVVPPSLVNMNLNPSLEKMIIKSIQKDAGLRFQNVFEIIEKLEHLALNPDKELDWQDDERYDEMTRTTVLPNLSEYLKDEDLPVKRSVPTTRAIEGHHEEKKGKIHPVGVAIATITGLLLGLILLVLITFKPFQNVKPIEEFELSDFVGLDYAAAMELAQEKNLIIKEVNRLFAQGVPANQILSQSPLAGTKVKSGRTVEVVVSAGARSAQMPDLKNKLLDEAKVLISNFGLTLGAVEEVTSDLPYGTVITQIPFAEADISSGMIVELIISAGPEQTMVLMPNLIGLAKDEALALLKDTGLNYGAIETVFSNDYASGLVTTQSIDVNTEVKTGTLVNLSVSIGREDGQAPTETTTAVSDGTVTRSYFIVPKQDQDITVVKVTKVVDGQEEVIYERIHRKEESSVRIDITAKGEVRLIFYLDNEVHADRTDIFE